MQEVLGIGANRRDNGDQGQSMRQGAQPGHRATSVHSHYGVHMRVLIGAHVRSQSANLSPKTAEGSMEGRQAERKNIGPLRRAKLPIANR